MKYYYLLVFVLLISCKRDDKQYFYSPSKNFKLVRWDTGYYTYFVVLSKDEILNEVTLKSKCYLSKKETDFREDWHFIGKWDSDVFKLYHSDCSLESINENKCENLKYIEMENPEYYEIYFNPRDYLIFRQID